MDALNMDGVPSFTNIDEDVHLVNSPIKEVRAIVNPRDDITLNQLTLRVWVLGLIACGLQAHFRARFWVEKNPIDVPMVVVQVGALILGHLMAKVVPQKTIRIPWTGKLIYLNPGGFNIKEHILITLFGHMGRQTPQVLQAVVLTVGYFDKEIYLWSSYMIMLFSQLISFLFVGLFINWASAKEMWWPKELLDVTFFRLCHESNDGTRSISYRKFFISCFTTSFLYEMFPGFFFPSLSSVSILCWLWKHSVFAQQVGSGTSGLGWFSFSCNWNSASNMGDPLAIPKTVVYHVLVGVILSLCIMTPAIYYTNSFDTRKFPLFSVDLFDKYGRRYDIHRVSGINDLRLNITAYEEYSPVFLSSSAISAYGFMLAAISCSMIYVLISYGRELWNQIKEDRYKWLMKNYEPLPRFWFFVVFLVALILGFISSAVGLGPEVDLPVSEILLSCVVVLVMIVPTGIFMATTGQMIPVSIVFQLLGGYVCSSKPIQYTVFRSCSNQSLTNSVFFLGSLKLGHYMKVAPRALFTVVLVGLVFGSTVGFGEIWFHLDAIRGHCLKDSDKCPWLDIVYTSTKLWGVIGPIQLIKDGIYTWSIIAFVVITMTLQALLCLFSEKAIVLRRINLPIILVAAAAIPPAMPADVNLWLVIGIFVPKILGKYFDDRSYVYQYLLSVSLTAGAGLMVFFFYLGGSPLLQSPTSTCPLATCPTAAGIIVDDCPN